MCGIAGYYNLSSLSISPTQRLSLFRSILDRGPDSSGDILLCDEKLYLCHSRLSIQDLSSSGNQPISSHSEHFMLIFNGEIYNHLELRLLLEENNPSIEWTGRSDSETLVQLVEHFGISKALDLANGMFALAIFDLQKSRLFLARDAFGQKPLYYHLDPELNRLTFSSYLHSIPLISPYCRVNSRDASPTLGFSLPPSTMLADCFELAPGSLLEINRVDNTLAISSRRWFSLYTSNFSGIPKLQETFLSVSKATAIRLIHDKLVQSVECCLASDVPLSCLLSGGIDSTLVTSIASKLLPSPPVAFTASFSDLPSNYLSLNESQHASKIAAHLGIEHVPVNISCNDLIAFVSSDDFPLELSCDPSLIPLALLSKQIKAAGFSVVLSGDGADEVFSGYSRHQLLPHLHKLSKYPLLGHSLIAVLTSLRALLPNTSFSGEYQRKIDKLITTFSPSKNIIQHYQRMFGETKLNFLVDHFTYLENLHLSDLVQLLDLLIYLPQQVLHKSDIATMHYGLELRSPFLDPSLVELGLILPSKYKNRRFPSPLSNKIVLRNILAQYIPQQLTNRPKSGFTLPLAPWLRSQLYTWSLQYLSQDVCEQFKIFSYNHTVLQLHQSHLSGLADNSVQLWKIISIHRWLMRLSI